MGVRPTPVAPSEAFLGTDCAAIVSRVDPSCVLGFVVCISSRLEFGVELGWVGTMMNSGTKVGFVCKRDAYQVSAHIATWIQHIIIPFHIGKIPMGHSILFL